MTAVEWLNSILDGQKHNPFDYDEWSIALEHAKEPFVLSSEGEQL